MPTASSRAPTIDLDHYAEALDGLVLQGGNDVAPESYGETPLHPDWHGDRVRDLYEMELVQAFVKAGKPVFGICRGLQLLNVMLRRHAAAGHCHPAPGARWTTATHHASSAISTRSSSSAASHLASLYPTWAAPGPTASTTRASRTWRRASGSRRAAPTTA